MKGIFAQSGPVALKLNILNNPFKHKSPNNKIFLYIFTKLANASLAKVILKFNLVLLFELRVTKQLK